MPTERWSREAVATIDGRPEYQSCPFFRLVDIEEESLRHAGPVPKKPQDRGIYMNVVGVRVADSADEAALLVSRRARYQASQISQHSKSLVVSAILWWGRALIVRRARCRQRLA